MKKIIFTLLLISSALIAGAKAKNIDSLQKQLDTAQNDTLKAKLYSSIGAELIQFTGPKDREITYVDAEKAITYVLKAIHYNAKTNDTLALRDNFDCLATAYFIERKFTQAKWFALQSNCISRNRRDVPAIINSLMQLASIKLAIKDYKMAEKDFNEAIVLCKYQNDVNRQIGIEKCLATLYDNSNRRKLAVAMEKHCDYLAANIDQISLQQAKVNKVRAAEQAKLLAQQAKVNAVKIAALAKVNTANQAKLAVQVKKEKLREQKYLATLKANTQWPLLFTVTASVETVYKSSGDESLGETETTFALNMPNNK